MSHTLPELLKMRDDLLRIRASGMRAGQYGEKRVEYGTDAQLAAALADLETRIRAASGQTRPGAVMFASSKGL